MARTLIRVDDIHKAYGPQNVLDGASLDIQEDYKLGVIGRNGAGKSTLCRLILGEEEADAGRIIRHDDLRLSYLEQKDPFLAGETVLDFLMRYSEREDWRCGKLAGRFLLRQDQLAKQVASLSGGFQTRVKLCAMLLREPNFLILDEPTNYLDLRTLMLLESFLRDWDGGFMIVSHDREFLKKTCTETIEVDHGRIEFHPAPVEDYLAYKEEQKKQAEHHNASVSLRAKQLQEFVDKNRAKASKASQAQSKMKMLDRLQSITIEHASATVAITVPPTEARTGAAFRAIGLGVGYPGKIIASGIELEVERGKHVAVLGDNGQGKTTLLRTLAGELPALAGAIKWGHAVRIGHYAQHVYQALPPDLTVQRYLEKAATEAPGHTTSQQVLDLAGAFLFRGEAAAKRIGVLSGGERSRLLLAGLLLGRYAVLLLDEPTNHLDFDTVEALAAALEGYNGTIVFVSHDRTFVSQVASDIIEVRDGRVTLYGDGYDAYCWRVEQEVRSEAAAPAVAAPAPERRDNRDRQERLQKARNQIKVAERDIAKLEAERDRLIQRMASDPVGSGAKDGPRLQTVVDELERLEARWLEAGQAVQELEK
ncbi:MAG: ATP-binding cassette domain-containing protein [Planctomycetes bacterium]|nr:ATP-binding cassette domain-containing protein [Planctomycetota bacterium]